MTQASLLLAQIIAFSLMKSACSAVVHHIHSSMSLFSAEGSIHAACNVSSSRRTIHVLTLFIVFAFKRCFRSVVYRLIMVQWLRSTNSIHSASLIPFLPLSRVCTENTHILDGNGVNKQWTKRKMKKKKKTNCKWLRSATRSSSRGGHIPDTRPYTRNFLYWSQCLWLIFSSLQLPMCSLFGVSRMAVGRQQTHLAQPKKSKTKIVLYC